MVDTVIETIIENICAALGTEFGDKYTLYREEAEQDLKKPCFFISCINSASKLFSGKRYFRSSQFSIRYFPEEETNKNKECCGAAERLLTCLEYLHVSGIPVRGIRMRYEAADGMLHFYVNYDLFVYKVSETVPVMEEVSSETSVKG